MNARNNSILDTRNNSEIKKIDDKTKPSTKCSRRNRSIDPNNGGFTKEKKTVANNNIVDDDDTIVSRKRFMCAALKLFKIKI